MKEPLNKIQIVTLSIGAIILFGIISYFIGTSGQGFMKSGLGGIGIMMILPIITIFGAILYLVGRLILKKYDYMLSIVVILFNLFASYQYHFGFW